MKNILSVFTPLSTEDKEFKQKLKNILGFSPTNLALYKQAFRHSSTCKNNSTNLLQSNERLEFLGDAILGAIIAEYLFKLFPTKNEGFLTQMRSKIVNGSNLYVLAKKFGLDVFLKSTLSKREKLNSSAYGDVFESFIGAIYLDKDFEKTKLFILNSIVKTHLDINELTEQNTDYKSQFQIRMQKEKNEFEYVILKHEFNGKEKTFVIQLTVNGIEQGVFEHKSKKIAEQKAAQLALEKMNG